MTLAAILFAISTYVSVCCRSAGVARFLLDLYAFDTIGDISTSRST